MGFLAGPALTVAFSVIVANLRKLQSGECAFLAKPLAGAELLASILVFGN